MEFDLIYLIQLSLTLFVQTQEDVERCKESWRLLRTGNAKGLKLMTKEGDGGAMVLFDEFYSRLFERCEAFRRYFSMDIRKRATILLRIVDQLTALDLTYKNQTEERFRELGKMHSSMSIRPWMYSVFIETSVILEREKDIGERCQI